MAEDNDGKWATGANGVADLSGEPSLNSLTLHDHRPRRVAKANGYLSDPRCSWRHPFALRSRRAVSVWCRGVPPSVWAPRGTCFPADRCHGARAAGGLHDHDNDNRDQRWDNQ